MKNDELEAGITLMVWLTVTFAGLFKGGAAGYLTAVFATILLVLILVQSSRLERKDELIKRDRERLRKECNRE